MAGAIAVLRLLRRLLLRNLQSFSAFGLNNLFLFLVFLLSGAHSPRTAFWTALPFLLILAGPLLFASSSEGWTLIPPSRAGLLPLSRRASTALRAVSVLLNPIVWVGALMLLLWAGTAAAVGYLLLAAAIEAVAAAARLRPPGRIAAPRLVPAIPGVLGGFVQLRLRELATTLDLYTAAAISLAGVLYRLLARSPSADAFPILALLVAISLSTTAQRTFGLTGPSGLTRCRLFPIPGWKILLGYDLAFLAAAALLTAPLSLRVGMSCSLVTTAVGRWPALRQSSAQQPWRFTRGDLRFGAAQVLLGGFAGMASARASLWFLPAALVLYGLSLAAGQRWWRSLS